MQLSATVIVMACPDRETTIELEYTQLCYVEQTKSMCGGGRDGQDKWSWE